MTFRHDREPPLPEPDPPATDEPALDAPPEAGEPTLLSCLDALGQLLRGGFFVALILALPALALAGAPAKVWIDGNDIDGPPPGPEHVPEHLGLALWATSVSSKVHAERTGAAATDTGLQSQMTVNGSLFGHSGYWSGQLDLFRLQQQTQDPFVISGIGFASGSTLGQAAVAARISREVFRFDMPWHAHYHVDFGFRYTLAGESIGNGIDRRSANEGFLCPEVTLVGVTPWDESSAFHTRTSFASNGATTGRETSVEFAITYNTHILVTDDAIHDVAIGLRMLDTQLGFTDKGTGQETTFKNAYIGPELSYTYRW